MKKLAVVLLISSLGACIPIEDKVSPVLESKTFENESKVYDAADSLIVNIKYRDNQQLERLVISVQHTNPLQNNAWRLDRDIELKGRGGIVYQQRLAFHIPANAATGTYNFSSSFQDFSRNTSAVTTDTFRIRGDEQAPTIENFSVSGIIKRANNTYLACRNDVIMLNGIIKDNKSLAFVSVGSSPEIVAARFQVEGREFRLADIFARSLAIKSDIPDNTIATVTLNVIDQADKTTSISFQVEVNCDDKAPEITNLTTFPRIEDNNQVRIVEGGNLRVLSGLITDNRLIQSYNINFNRVNANPSNVFRRENVNTNRVDLGDILRNNPFNLPSTARAGDNFEWILTAIDTSRNTSTPPTRLLITVQRDASPKIFVTNRYVSGTEVNTTDTVQLRRQNSVRIEGKIDDDSQILYLRMLWGEQGRQQTLLNLSGTNILSMPFDLSDSQSMNIFTVPAVAPVGSLYVLTIIVKDLVNTEVQQSLYFRITP